MPDMNQYQVAKSTRSSNIALVLVAVIVVVLIIAPSFVSRSLLQDMFFVLTMITLAQCWNLLAGYGGLVSIGQQAFVGLGAYTGFGLAILMGVNPLLAILLAGVVGALLSIPTAFIVFRLHGAYFAIGTWVAAEVYRLLFAQWKALGGGTGTSLPSDVARSLWDRRLGTRGHGRQVVGGERHHRLLDCADAGRCDHRCHLCLFAQPQRTCPVRDS